MSWISHAFELDWTDEARAGYQMNRQTVKSVGEPAKISTHFFHPCQPAPLIWFHEFYISR